MLSPRIAGNLIYVDLRSRHRHSEDCTADGCAPKCGLLRFDTDLTSPLLPWEIRDQQRLDARAAELQAGRIPGGAIPAPPEALAEAVPGSGDAA